VQRASAILAVLAVVATSAQAQRRSWQAEFGIQGGVLKAKPAGTGADDASTFLQLPGGTLFNGIVGTPPLFAIIPWKDKIAIEPQLGLLNLSTTNVGDATLLSTVLRLDYAVTPKFYVALGAAHRWLSANGSHDGQLGLVTAAGYRLPVTNRVHGRVEANVTFRKRDDSSSPVNTYSLLAGLSANLKGAGARATAQPRRATSHSVWQSAIGIQGGYLNQHTVGGGQDVSGLFVPGHGNDLRQSGSSIGGPPVIFAILPLSRKIAIEPGLDVHAVKQTGSNGFAATATGRLNYAVSGGWYAAAGASFTNINVGGTSGTLTGAQAAWGYRFPLTGDLGGRVELLFDMQGKNTDLGIGPVNSFGVMFGTTLPLH
jgi:hypothetical protein